MKSYKKLLTMCLSCVLCSTATVQAAQYTYDKLGRVVKVVYDDKSSVEYEYDNNGNITRIEKKRSVTSVDEDEVIEKYTSELSLLEYMTYKTKVTLSVNKNAEGDSVLSWSDTKNSLIFLVYKAKRKSADFKLDGGVIMSEKNEKQVEPSYYYKVYACKMQNGQVSVSQPSNCVYAKK